MGCNNDKSCENIKKLSKLQNEFIHGLSGIIEKLDESQLMVEGNAFDSINSSDTVLNLTKDGITCIDDLLDKIAFLHKVLENSSEKMQQLNSLSNMVMEFTSVIGGISNKTNTLSLNASIEAARAGKEGEGFALVANEIRDLATLSSKSSNEITETIQVIQMFIGEIVEAITKVHDIVNRQNDMISDVKNVMHNVLIASQVANDVSHNMESEIAYQRDITDSARNAIEEITKLAIEHGIYNN